MAQQQQPQRGTGRPGAMTMAMAAVKTAAGPKVLRIGVIQGTKMTEERIIRNRDTVSVGTTEKNTFTVAAPEFPSHFDLFPMVGGQYALNFTDGMEGRLALPQGVKTLDEIRKAGVAKRVGTSWQVPLGEQSRGKVQIGDITFLFQFVVPPPPQPKPQLPAAIRAGWVKNIDWTYNACFSFFLVLAIASIAYVEYIYDPIVDEQLGLDDIRLVRLLTPPATPEDPPPPEQNPAANTPAETGTAAAATPTPTRGAGSSRSNQADAAARAAGRANAAAAAASRAADAAISALTNSAEFAALTGATDTGRGSARDALASGGLMAGTERDLANLGGISTASGAGGGVRRGGLAASASGGGGLGGRGLGSSGTVAGGGGNVGSGGEVVVERTIRGNASLGGGDTVGGEGSVDANAVASIIRRQLGGIRSCYERALRNNPTLSGRLELRFTIGTSGRVTSASTSGLQAAPEVGPCVVSRIRGLVFPEPSDGSVDFSFPFTFTPGS